MQSISQNINICTHETTNINVTLLQIGFPISSPCVGISVIYKLHKEARTQGGNSPFSPDRKPESLIGMSGEPTNAPLRHCGLRLQKAFTVFQPACIREKLNINYRKKQVQNKTHTQTGEVHIKKTSKFYL